jgi:ABC-type transport system involved in multi-copper enzyme maturation permease subunit
LLGPIFNREALTVPRRPQHYVGRAAYLGLLWLLGLTAWQATVGWNQTPMLYDTGRFGPLFFRLSIFVQLGILLFFSALSAAGAVAQEKDRRTFILLLLSDLSSTEIVLGKMLGSLLPILFFLGGVIPLLMLTIFLGGVAPEQVAQAVIVLVATTLVAGSVGNLVALWRDKTFPALALTFLILVFYLVLTQGLALLAGDEPPDWLEHFRAWVDPFKAIDSVLQPPSDPAPLLPPAYGFAVVMAGIGLLLNLWAIWKVRVWNPSGEPIMQRENVDEDTTEDREKRRSIHAAPGPVREVGENPILWRETATRAYGRRPLLVKLAYFLVAGLICYAAIRPLFGPGGPGSFAAAYGLVPLGILSLLLLAAQSATAITSERDLGALDLLLVTDLTPKEFIYGKLAGIIYNAKEYLLPPLLLLGFYAYLDVFHPGSSLLARPAENAEYLQASRSFEAFACLLAAGLVLMAFTMFLGVHVSLRTINSRLAILNTLSTIFFLSVGTLVCVYLILINGQFEYQWSSFLAFTIAGVGGLMWILNGHRPSAALVLASWLCPFAVLYCVMGVMVGKPGSRETADPLIPAAVIVGAFLFAIQAMRTPLISEFDIALGRTTGPGE